MSKEYIKGSQELIKTIQERNGSIPNELIEIQKILEKCEERSESLVVLLQEAKKNKTLDSQGKHVGLLKEQDQELSQIADIYKKLMNSNWPNT